MTWPEDDELDQAVTSPADAAGRRSPSGARSGDASRTPVDPAVLAALAQRYEAIEELGRGGMGVVYRARDRETGAEVALKVLLPEIAAKPELIERFKAELILARKITHKNVCRVHELIRLGNVAAISMEYVEGESLRSLLKRVEGLSIRHGLKIARQMLAGLAEAHAQGVVHRDLKPENILIARDGTVKVMDFGIARSLETGTTSTGHIMGTPAYMSPEQAQGTPADARSDVYSLGLILYEMFTGTPVFEADTASALLLKHLYEAPRPPREVEPYLPAFLDRVILRCLEKAPKNRFPSAAAVDVALAGKAEQPAEPAAPEKDPPVPLHLASWQRSDFFLLAAGILGFILILFAFSRAFPYSAVKIMDEKSGEQAVNVVLQELKVDGTPQYREVSFGGLRDYPRMAQLFGPSAAYSILEQEASTRAFSVSDATRKVEGWFRINQAGYPAGAYLFPSLGAPASIPSAEERRRHAVQMISSVFRENTARVERLLSKTDPKTKSSQFTYPMPQHGARPDREVSVWWNLQSFGLGLAEPVWVRQYVWGNLEPDGSLATSRYAWTLSLLTVLAIGLFFLRRLHRTPFSRANLALALLATTLPFIFFHEGLTYEAWQLVPLLLRGSPGIELPPDWAVVVRVILKTLLFLFLYAVALMVMTVAQYYMRKNDPTRFSTFARLCKAPFNSVPAGFAIIRGLLLGLALAAVFTVFVAWASPQRLVQPETSGLGAAVSVGLDYSPSRGATSPSAFSISLRAFTIAFLEAFVLSWVLLGLPAALLQRVTKLRVVCLGLIAALCFLTGYCLLGLSTWPLAAWYALTALQGLFLAMIYLQWDFLTSMATVFTLETWLVGFAVFQIFRSTGSLVSMLPIVLWTVFALAGFAIAFRPQITAGYRRVAAVFE